MFSEIEYAYYRRHVKRALTNDEIFITDVAVPAEDMDSVCYWNDSDDSTFEEFNNITIYHKEEEKAFYCIDIFDNLIQIDYYGYEDTYGKSKLISTELFSTGSDEEFFQVGTVQDLTFIEEDLLRQFIELSLIARKNKNNKESE